MPTFVVLAKYNADALSKIRKDGYASRLEQMNATLGSPGGKVERVVFLDSTDWDFIGLVEGDDDTAFALGSFSTAAGIFERTAVYESRTAAEMDAVVARSINWKAPGSASS